MQAVELKFNCFFLMPVVDAFPTRLREELEQAYEEDLDEVFDVAAVRCALESRLRSLESELHQVSPSSSPAVGAKAAGVGLSCHAATHEDPAYTPGWTRSQARAASRIARGCSSHSDSVGWHAFESTADG